MGHNRIPVLERTRWWNDVVALLEEGGADDAVVAASARAAESDLLRAADDPVFVEAVRLLLNIPLAARSEAFGEALRDAGLPIGNHPDLLDIVAASTECLDRVRRGTRTRTDFGEIAARALTRTLTECIGDTLPGLFGATAEDVRLSVRRLSWSKGVSAFARTFFGHVVSGSLSCWLDRSLGHQIGEDRRFPTGAARDRFDRELDAYAFEATRIIREFSGGWYGKTLYDRGGLSSESAASFGAVALSKTVAELRIRSGSGG